MRAESGEHLSVSRVQQKIPSGSHSRPHADTRTDEEIVLAFQRGDTAAFDVLVARFKDPLLNYIMRYSGRFEYAEDILQETFVRVYEKADQYKTIAKFSTWIYTIATNLVRSEHRRPANRIMRPLWEPVDDEEPERAIADPTAQMPDDIADARQRERRIQQALLELPEPFRETVILRDIQDLTYEEISVITGQRIGTVKSRLNRGRTMLHDLLRDLYE